MTTSHTISNYQVFNPETIRHWDESPLDARLDIIPHFMAHLKRERTEVGNTELLFFGRLVTQLRFLVMKQVNSNF